MRNVFLIIVFLNLKTIADPIDDVDTSEDEWATFTQYREFHVHFPRYLVVGDTISTNAQIIDGAISYRLHLLNSNAASVLTIFGILNESSIQFGSSRKNFKVQNPEWVLINPVSKDPLFEAGKKFSVNYKILDSRTISISHGPSSKPPDFTVSIPSAVPYKTTSIKSLYVTGDVRSVQIAGSALGKNDVYSGKITKESNPFKDVTRPLPGLPITTTIPIPVVVSTPSPYSYNMGPPPVLQQPPIFGNPLLTWQKLQ